MEEVKEELNKKPLDLDLPNEEPPEVIVDQSATTAPAAANPSKPSPMSADQQSGYGDDGLVQRFSDHELEEQIRRQSKNIETMASRLKDNGEKIKVFLKRLEEERERRKFSRLDKSNEECKKPTRAENSEIVGAPDGSRQESRSPQDHPQSTFGKEFSKRIDENSNSRRNNSIVKEFSDFNDCDRRKKRSNGRMPPNARKRGRSSSNQRPIQFTSSASIDDISNGDLNGIDSSAYSLPLHSDGENLLNSCAKKRNAFEVPLSEDLRASEDQSVVLVDEEDQAPEAKEHAEKLTECMKETKIYYPSRDDPDPVIICSADVDCLAPEAFLTSTIMNFYIRYLQQQAVPMNRVTCDYLFFNTYFYEKLKEAVTYKGIGNNTKFVKFRRWWKGVNIFQKAYVLIPIHQNLHWSLVIICNPDKEDESGPIILHLDSLGLHSSRTVFENIRSYMKEEWNCLNQEAHTDLPLADSIWKHLPRRIEEKRITVPQQRNDYDCGLFVLFFMERFIVDAPERLVKKKDLPSMFGREWFKPEEASGLRRKIQNLLKLEFQHANRIRRTISTSPMPESGNSESVKDKLE